MCFVAQKTLKKERIEVRGRGRRGFQVDLYRRERGYMKGFISKGDLSEEGQQCPMAEQEPDEKHRQVHLEVMEECHPPFQEATRFREVTNKEVRNRISVPSALTWRSLHVTHITRMPRAVAVMLLSRLLEHSRAWSTEKTKRLGAYKRKEKQGEPRVKGPNSRSTYSRWSLLQCFLG